MNLIDYGSELPNRIRMLVENLLVEEDVEPDFDFEFDTWEYLSDDWDINVWGNPEDGISVAIYPVRGGETQGDMEIVLDNFTYLPEKFFPSPLDKN